MSDLLADLALMKSAARAAGTIVMEYFGRHGEVVFKAAEQPLTEADLAADRSLRQHLCGSRPEYAWLSEESAATPDRLQRSRVWIVDPIDGTRSFIAGRPEFTISIGLSEGGRPVAGVVYNPATDELFSAALHQGARLEADGDTVELTVGSGFGDAPLSTLLASRTEIRGGEFIDFDESRWQVEPVGSTAYKLARIAAGRGDVFLSRGPKSEWDICAGVLLVQEAGGIVTDVRGDAPRFNRADPYVHGILACNAAMHAVMMRKMASLQPSQRLRKAEDG